MTNKLQEFIEDLCPQPVDLARIMSVISNKIGDNFCGLHKDYHSDSFSFRFEFGYSTGISSVDWDINKKFFEQKPEIQLEIAELLGFEND
jgi:hypothetical protein